MLAKFLAVAVLPPFIEVLAMMDSGEDSIQARLLQLARDERGESAALARSAMVLSPALQQQDQGRFLAPLTGQQTQMTTLMDMGKLSPVDMHVEKRQSTASLAEAGADQTKAPSDRGNCSPACKSGHGICVNNVCLCHSPWSGESCEVAEAEALEDEIPFEKESQKMVSPEVGEALKRKVDMPFAVFIWSTLLVVTFFCTALCPRLCGHQSSGADATADYSNIDADMLETQYDIVEAWTFDDRKPYEREEQNDSERRKWFEDNVCPKLQQIKWPKVRH